MSGDIGLEPLTLGTHMGPDVTRHRLESLATRCEAILHVAKTDVAQDSKTEIHCRFCKAFLKSVFQRFHPLLKAV